MTDEQMDMARAFVACPKWRWLKGMSAAGMVYYDGRRHFGSFIVAAVAPDGRPAAEMGRKITARKFTREFCIIDDALPDLADPVTVAAVLVVVREEWDSAGAFAMPFRASDPGGPWSVLGGPRNGQASMDIIGSGPSELAALLAALQAAPVTP